MEKVDARFYLSDLEAMIDKKLKKWKKDRIDQGKVVQFRWQFELAHVFMDVYWGNGKERIKLECHCSKRQTIDEWDGLNSRTFANVIDRIGNFAQIYLSTTRE